MHVQIETGIVPWCYYMIDENEENEDVYDNSGSSSHSGEGDDEYYVDSDNEEGYDSAGKKLYTHECIK